MKNEFKLQFILYLFMVLLLIVLSSKIKSGIDFSENKIYSLSTYTKNLFTNLNATVSITWIRSQNAKKFFPNLNYLEALLEQYSEMPHCTFEIVDSARLSEEALSSLGIYPEQIKNTSRDEAKINNVYSGILIEYAGMTKLLPYVFNLQFIEYTIANNLTALIEDSLGLSAKRRIYVLTFKDALQSEYMYVRSFLEYDNFIPISVNDEALTELDPEVPLIVIGSKFFTDSQIQMLANFLQAGGSAGFFVSGCEINLRSNWACKAKREDRLLELLSQYGFIISNDILFDIFNFPLQMVSRDGISSQSINYPFWLRVNSEQARLEKSFFAGYNTLQMYWPSSLTLIPHQDTMLEAVLLTSNQAKRIIENFVTDPFVFSEKDYSNIEKNTYTLAAISTNNKTKQRLFVMSDEYFLSRCIEFSNSDSNLQLLISICHFLSSDEKILELKNKNESIKAFKVLEDKNKIETIKTFSRILNLFVIPLSILVCFILKKHSRKRKN